MIRVPNALAVNVVVVNQHVLVQGVQCRESRRVLQEAAQERNLTVHMIDTSELGKVDGALSCCSVLLSV